MWQTFLTRSYTFWTGGRRIEQWNNNERVLIKMIHLHLDDRIHLQGACVYCISRWLTYISVWFSSSSCDDHRSNHRCNPLSLRTQICQNKHITFSHSIEYWQAQCHLSWPTFLIIQVRALRKTLWLIPTHREITITVAHRRVRTGIF